MVVKIGPVDGRVAARGKTRTCRHAASVGLFADGRKIHLRVAAQAEVIVARYQHFRMQGPVHLMAGRAAFTHGLVFKHKRPALFFVAFKTRLVDPFQTRRGPGFDVRTVRAVAGGAVHLAFQDRMVVRQAEFHFFVGMALKARGHVFFGVENIFRAAPLFDVEAGRPVAQARGTFRRTGLQSLLL
jgi:hypothetical protein